MKNTRTTRLAAAGAVAALTTAGLVAGTTTAEAATASGNYVCSAGQTPLGQFPMNADVPLLPPEVLAGWNVDEGLLAVNSTMGIPAGVAGLLGPMGVVGGAVSDFAISFGDQAIPAPLTIPTGGIAPDPAQAGALLASASGSNAAFRTPDAGVYNVTMPRQFTFVPATATGPLQLAVTCVSDAPASFGQVEVKKQTSTMVSKVSKTATGYKAVVTVKRQLGENAFGKVVAKLGAKKWTKALTKGKASFALPKSAKGKTVTLLYKGDSATEGTKSSALVK